MATFKKEFGHEKPRIYAGLRGVWSKTHFYFEVKKKEVKYEYTHKIQFFI